MTLSDCLRHLLTLVFILIVTQLTTGHGKTFDADTGVLNGGGKSSIPWLGSLVFG